MKYLLDTHTFLWALGETDQLPDTVKAALRNPNNHIFVSSISLWEIAIKVRIGKLTVEGLKVEELCDLAEEMEFELISMTPEDAAGYGSLGESTHKDPFDRMLIWQSITRGMTIISKDSQFKKFEDYGLKTYW